MSKHGGKLTSILEIQNSTNRLESGPAPAIASTERTLALPDMCEIYSIFHRFLIKLEFKGVSPKNFGIFTYQLALFL
jgi:hypothetical protein